MVLEAEPEGLREGAQRNQKPVRSKAQDPGPKDRPPPPSWLSVSRTVSCTPPWGGVRSLAVPVWIAVGGLRPTGVARVGFLAGDRFWRSADVGS